MLQNVKEYIPMNAVTKEEVEQYYRVRSEEVNMQLVTLEKDKNGCYVACFKDKVGECYQSVYIPAHLRGQGLIKEYNHLNFITTRSCNIEHVLYSLGFKYKLHTGWCDFTEYETIKGFYKNNKAKRSGEFLMWHITSGCQIMQHNGATPEAIKAYMLHPILQGDDEFLKHNNLLDFSTPNKRKISINLLEYRKVANSYLCKPYTDGWDREEIREACPIIYEDVRQMLLADKIQNREDFLKFHKGSHPRSEQLNRYFNNWIIYLYSQEGKCND